MNQGRRFKSFAELAEALSDTPLESQENRFRVWEEKLKVYGILQKPVNDDYRKLVSELQEEEKKASEKPQRCGYWRYPDFERPWDWFYETVL